MDQLKIALFQYDIQWEDPRRNRYKIEGVLKGLPRDVDLLILPEMFTTGFTMNCVKMAEDMNGPTIHWMKLIAADKEVILMGSIIIKENTHYYNRCLIVTPDGDVQYYDKRHLFSYANEDDYFMAGTQRRVMNIKGWKVCPLICYDLRFPVWSRNDESYDLLIYVANFPAKRALAWNTLLKARAIENQAYTVGLNRVGTDNNEIYYQGDSQVIDFEGHPRMHIKNEEKLQYIQLSKNSLEQFRQDYQFLNDADHFVIQDDA